MVEIAEVFTEARGFLLNKPLVQFLQHLGVPPKSFLDLQNRVVSDVKAETSTLSSADGFLSKYNFGGLFRVPFIVQHLKSLGVDLPQLPRSLRAFMEKSARSRPHKYI